MSDDQEIELKFAIREKIREGDFLKIFNKYFKEENVMSADYIKQDYLPNNENGDTVRIRQKKLGRSNDYIYYLTTKSAPTHDGLSRTEIESEISKEDYERYLLAAENGLEKIRITVEDNLNQSGDPVLLEFDMYYGDLEGLITVEAEFPDIQSARSYEWHPIIKDLFKDVTPLKEYSNASLAKNGKPKGCCVDGKCCCKKEIRNSRRPLK